MTAQRCDLVLGGGGVRGIAHIGALTALGDAGYGLHRVAGASVGAVMGAFAVAGVPAREIKELFEEVDFRGLALSDLVGRFANRRRIGALVERITGEPIEPLEWISEVLEGRGVTTFGDLRVDDDRDEAPERAYRLVVRCLDVVQRRVVRLPWDYPRYGMDPDRQSVAEAVRASMSIPLMYEPVPIGGDGAPRGLLVDGGLTSGFPVSVLDREDRGEPRWPTFGVRLLARSTSDGQLPEGDVAMLRAVLDALREASDLLEPMTECDARRTIRIDVSGVRALDLDVTEDRDLFRDGYTAVERFLADWDLDAYRRDCR